jgi:hypothetical protein
MIWLLLDPLPLPVSKLDRQHAGRRRKRDNFLMGGDGGRGRGGAKSYDHKKAWSSISHQILSGCFHLIKYFDFVGPDVLCAVEILHGAAGEQQREEALALHLLLPVLYLLLILCQK